MYQSTIYLSSVQPLDAMDDCGFIPSKILKSKAPWRTILSWEELCEALWQIGKSPNRRQRGRRNRRAEHAANFKHQCCHINIDTSWGFLKSHKVHSWRQKSTQKSFTLHEAEVCLPEVAYSMFSPSLEVREIFREASLGDSRESIDTVNSEHSSDSSPANSSSHQSVVIV